MFDILVAGEINPDLILSGNVLPEFGQVEKLVDSAVLTIGSSSAIFACGAARLGLKVAFIGVCGEDVFGRFMLDEMQKRGVDVGNVIVRADRPTGICVILNRGSDRAILTHPGLDRRSTIFRHPRWFTLANPSPSRGLLFFTNKTSSWFACFISTRPFAWADNFT